MSSPPFYDVLIAGAGPVGLFLACELRLAGCSVLVVEKAPDPHLPLKRAPFGLRGLSTASCDSLDRRGLLDPLVGRAVGANTPGTHWLRQERQPGGHFAGIQFFHDQVDIARWPYRLGDPRTLATDMASIEAVLTERVQALGVEIRRGAGIAGLSQFDQGVSVESNGENFVGGWLVGCDGAHSIVRKAAGFEFAGTAPEFTGYSVEVELLDPGVLAPGRRYTAEGMYTFAPPGVVAMVDFDGGAYHRSEPIKREHVESVLRRISGTDARVGRLVQAATWTDRAYQTSAYRSGRVLLAGDAAHIHSPLGGQGLNLGLGDAMNLGWKLAATVRSEAPAGLLDSYESERRPIAGQILDWSRAQVSLMRPSPSARALQSIVHDLIGTRDGATYFAERIWGVGLRYDLGESHPLAGRTAPDFELADGTRLNERLRNGRGLLLDFEARPWLAALAEQWSGQLEHLQSDATDRLGLAALLVRPDGIVAWASGAGDWTDGAAAAVQRWYGQPSPKGFAQRI